MPLTLAPGVHSQETPFQAGGALTDSNLIRFRTGLIEKLGGCTRLSSNRFHGIATDVMPWAALDRTQYIGIGTSTHPELLTAAGAIVDITPAAGVGSGDWSLDKWGQDLVGAPAGGTVYHWVPPVAGGNIAVPVLNAPAEVAGLFVAAPEQQVITFGAHSATLGAQDPLLVAWCDVSQLTIWTATTSNQAGTFRIPNGSEIVGGMWTGLSGLLWTDLDLWSMTFAGFPLVYGFNRLAPNCGLIARRAADVLGTRIAWMSQNDFFAFQGGQVQVVPCPVHDFVFDNLDRAFSDAIHCDSNTYGGEFMWRFPTIGSGGVCNAYVKWTPMEERGWDKGFGAPTISAWSDQSVIGPPVGCDYTGLAQQFETARDFDGVVLTSLFETGWFALSSGQDFVFIERILPDFILNAGGVIQLTITVADEIPPDDTDYPVRVYGPYTIDRATPYIIPRCRGRVARLTVTCSAPDTFWRYGKPPALAAPDGRR